MIDPRYGYDPHQGVEQFNEAPPADATAPVTYWLRDMTSMDFVDVAMPDGHVIRAIGRDVAEECYPSGKVLPLHA